MIDIHLHILPGVDDGSPSMESSLEMAQLALESGVKSVIVTPHCNLPDTICLNARQMQGQVQQLREALRRAETPLKVYGGMEIFGTPQTARRLQSGQLCTLAGSRYPLIEFPFVDYGREATEILDSVLRLGLRPIVAHPERYRFTQSEPRLLNVWVEMGCLLQINRGSLFGRFGRHAEALAHGLMERNFVSFVASDAHSSTARTPWLRDVAEFLLREYPKELAWALLEENPRRVLENQEIVTDEPIWFE